MESSTQGPLLLNESIGGGSRFEEKKKEKKPSSSGQQEDGFVVDTGFEFDSNETSHEAWNVESSTCGVSIKDKTEAHCKSQVIRNSTENEEDGEVETYDDDTCILEKETTQVEAVDATDIVLQHQNQQEDHDDKSPWILPQGAEHIVRGIAAEQILLELLGDIFSMAVVGACHKPAPRKAEFTLLLSVVRSFPAVCQRQYDFSWEDFASRQLYPLAAICCLRPPLHVVQCLYQAYKPAIHCVEATKESLPLHYACGFGASLEVIQFLYNAYPPAVSACRTDQVTPLHLAAAYYKGSPDVLHFLLDKYPQGAQQAATDIGWLPMHSAAHGAAPVEILERLFSLVPESVAATDSKGRTPLHIACERRGGNEDGIRFLLQQAPQSIHMEDESRFTPISLAAMHQSISVLQLLLDRHEMLEDNHGVTLLHMAAFQNTTEVIDYLAEAYPHMITARVRDNDAYTPLLAAVRHDAAPEVVRTLIRHDPSTLDMPDGDGRPPIESARQAGADQAVLQVLQEELNLSAAAAFDHTWPTLLSFADTEDESLNAADFPYSYRNLESDLRSISTLDSDPLACLSQTCASSRRGRRNASPRAIRKVFQCISLRWWRVLRSR